MFKRFPLYLSKYSIVPAVLYIVPAIIFLRDETFSQTWLLYVGNALFLCYVFLFELLLFNRQHITNSSITAGLAVTITGVIISCVLVLLCTLLFAPGLFHLGSSGIGLTNKPPALAQKSTFPIWFILFATATIGNFSAGAFSSIMTGTVLKDKSVPGKDTGH